MESEAGAPETAEVGLGAVGARGVTAGSWGIPVSTSIGDGGVLIVQEETPWVTPATEADAQSDRRRVCRTGVPGVGVSVDEAEGATRGLGLEAPCTAGNDGQRNAQNDMKMRVPVSTGAR